MAGVGKWVPHKLARVSLWPRPSITLCGTEAWQPDESLWVSPQNVVNAQNKVPAIAKQTNYIKVTKIF